MAEEPAFPRPSASSIRSAWKELFSDPLLSASRLKASALSKEGIGPSAGDGGILLRSVYWRLYHGLLPPPTSLNLFEPTITSSRRNYQSLRERYLIAPDGRWADDCTGSEEYHASRTGSSASNGSSLSRSPAGTTFDPLSLDEESPWKTWYAHLDVRKVIMQDVDRTFPDIPYFTLERVRRCMVTMLFLFTVLNPDVGYRQGMHELLAVCLITVDRDSLDYFAQGSGSDMTTRAMETTLDRRYIEHDAFDLFTAIMKPAKAFYEWRQEEGPRRAQGGQAPIIVRCNNLHSSLIRRIDPQLWERLENEGIEAQLWAMRWYKLIFTRELPFSVALRLWDGIFAEDTTLGLLDFICVAMVLLIRNELLDSDHAGLLTNLLRYPAPSTEYPFSPSLILAQALLLRNTITPTAGVEVVIQNHEVLGVRAQPPPREPEQPKVAPRPPPSRVQGLAAGLFERAQAAGLDRALFSTVADIRRNIPDSAYSYLPNLPFSPSQQSPRHPSGPFSTIPSNPTLPRAPQPIYPSHSPALTSSPIHPNASTESIASIKTLRDAERELAELRLAMVGMGKAMSEWITSLPESTGSTERTGLERVRDTLLDAAGSDIDDIVKEWGWHDGLEAASSRAETPVSMLETGATESDRPIALAPTNMAATTAPAVRQNAPPSIDAVVASPASAPRPFADEITPTPRAVASFTTPSLPSNQATARSPIAAGPSKPHLYLGNHRPVTSLPRTPPLSAPIPRSPVRQTDPLSPQEKNKRIDVLGDVPMEGRRNGSDPPDPLDPLAGLGVTSAKHDVGGHGRRNKGGGVDPLLGVGLR